MCSRTVVKRQPGRVSPHTLGYLEPMNVFFIGLDSNIVIFVKVQVDYLKNSVLCKKNEAEKYLYTSWQQHSGLGL